MPKNDDAGGLVSPENLWGRPLTRPTAKPGEKKITKVTGMRTDDEDDMDDDEIDVDDELENADEAADEESETDDEYEDTVASAEEDDGEVDDDGLTYSPEAGDDTAAEEDEEAVVSAVDDDANDDDAAEETDVEEDAGYAAPTQESRNRSMADKKKVSISDHVRAEIEKRENAGASLRGVDIVAALAKRNIAVSAAQVSQLLKKAGLGGAPRKPAAAAPAQTEKSRIAEKAKKHSVTAVARPTPGLKRHAAPAPVAEPRTANKAPAAKTGNGFRVPMDQLQAVETFVKACGGSFASASRILTAAQQLSETFGG